MYRGSTPCQRTCGPHKIEPFRLISRTRDALCTLAPGSACWQHPPAGTSEQSCSVYHPASTADYTTLLVQSNSACRLGGNIPCQRTCAQHRIEPFCLGSQNCSRCASGLLAALVGNIHLQASQNRVAVHTISEQSCSAHQLALLVTLRCIYKANKQADVLLTHHVSGLVLRTKMSLSALKADNRLPHAPESLAAPCGNSYPHLRSKRDIAVHNK